MKSLKISFKQSTRNVIEQIYINEANELGWCRDFEQRILNKSHMYMFIRSTNMEGEKLMRDLWEFQYESFRKNHSGLIQFFVTKDMDENNIAYQDDLDGNKKNTFRLHGGNSYIY